MIARRHAVAWLPGHALERAYHVIKAFFAYDQPARTRSKPRTPHAHAHPRDNPNGLVRAADTVPNETSRRSRAHLGPRQDNTSTTETNYQRTGGHLACLAHPFTLIAMLPTILQSPMV